MSKSDLSICIPTFNRGEILDSSLNFHLSYTKDLKIPFIISDNCSDDATEQVGKRYENEFDFISYHRQERNNRDHNFPFVLRQSKTDYAWLLPDKQRISPKGFHRVLECIKEDNYDLIVSNHKMRVKNIPTQVYSDHLKMFEEIGWHMTDISVLVFSKQFIKEVPFENFSGTNFMHIGGIFSALANKKDFKVLWLNENVFERLAYKNIPGGWNASIFEVWIDSWCNAMLSLPPEHYPIESKVKCIRTHNLNTKLFKKRNLIKFRIKGIYTKDKYNKYKHLFALATKSSKLFFMLVLLIPSLKFKK